MVGAMMKAPVVGCEFRGLILFVTGGEGPIGSERWSAMAIQTGMTVSQCLIKWFASRRTTPCNVK